jgi:hypothetical protein
MMRSLLIAVLVASLASAGFATAAATRPLDVTLRGTVTESGVSGCCAIYWNFEGTTMIRGLGFVNFTGSYADVTLYLSQQSRRVLYLELAAPNGDTLTLTGEVNYPWGEQTPPSPWTVADANGRFSGYSGSGTFTTETIDSTITFSLTGTITSA